MNLRFLRPMALLLGTLALMPGCTVGPDYHRPASLPGQAALPDHFKEGTVAMQPARPRDGAVTEPAGVGQEWWRMFSDPVLDELMAQMPAANQDLAVAEAKYRQAISTQEQARAALWPSLAASAGSSRSRTHGSANSTSVDPTDTVSVGLSAQWELDLWGRLRRSLESSTASAAATAGDLAAVRLSLQAQLASSYASLRLLDAQKELLAATVQAYDQSLQRQENRYRQGVIAQLDVVQARSQLLTAQAQLTNVDVQRTALEHALAVLVGKAPAAFAVPPRPGIPLTMPDIPQLLPATMLERRADVAAAERRMAAANAQIGVAEAAFFPSLSLDASGGYTGAKVHDLIRMPNQVWSLGSSLAITLFDAGARQAMSEQARAAYDQQVASYRQVVLTALQETEDSLAALRILAQQEQQQQQVVAANQKLVALTSQQYEAGTVGALNVLVVQNTLLASQRDLLTIREQRLLAAIALLKALGGGWQGLSG